MNANKYCDHAKYCPQCGRIFGFYAKNEIPPGYKGDLCCGSRLVQFAPIALLMAEDAPDQVKNEMRRIRRRIEDLIRKDKSAFRAVLTALSDRL